MGGGSAEAGAGPCSRGGGVAFAVAVGVGVEEGGAGHAFGLIGADDAVAVAIGLGGLAGLDGAQVGGGVGVVAVGVAEGEAGAGAGEGAAGHGVAEAVAVEVGVVQRAVAHEIRLVLGQHAVAVAVLRRGGAGLGRAAVDIGVGVVAVDRIERPGADRGAGAAGEAGVGGACTVGVVVDVPGVADADVVHVGHVDLPVAVVVALVTHLGRARGDGGLGVVAVAVREHRAVRRAAQLGRSELVALAVAVGVGVAQRQAAQAVGVDGAGEAVAVAVGVRVVAGFAGVGVGGDVGVVAVAAVFHEGRVRRRVRAAAARGGGVVARPVAVPIRVQVDPGRGLPLRGEAVAIEIEGGGVAGLDGAGVDGVGAVVAVQPPRRPAGGGGRGAAGEGGGGRAVAVAVEVGVPRDPVGRVGIFGREKAVAVAVDRGLDAGLGGAGVTARVALVAVPPDRHVARGGAVAGLDPGQRAVAVAVTVRVPGGARAGVAGVSEVDTRVAVVIDAVAALGRAGVDRRVGLIAVAADGDRARGADEAVAGGERRGASAVAVGVDEPGAGLLGLGGDVGVLVVGEAVAVVVEAVAELGGGGVDGGVRFVAVVAEGGVAGGAYAGVADGVGAGGVAVAVIVEVLEPQRGVLVGREVPVVVVDLAVAVVVEAVADLFLIGVQISIGVVAVLRFREGLLGAALFAVRDGRFRAEAVTVSVDPAENHPVAVVVEVVEDLRATFGADLRVIVVTVVAVGDEPVRGAGIMLARERVVRIAELVAVAVGIIIISLQADRTAGVVTATS